MAEESVEATLTSSQDQSGINSMVEKAPLITSWTLGERSLITMDRQEKQLHHNENGRVWWHEKASWAPKVAAEDLEWYFNGWGLPLRSVRSKHQAGLPSLWRQSWKRTQITSICEKQQGFCLLRRDGWRLREPLKGPKPKISFANTHRGLQQWERRVDWRNLKRIGGWWLWGENWRNSHQDPCAESFPRRQETSFSGRALFSKWHQPEGKQYPCPQELLCPTIWCLNQLSITAWWV